MKASRRSLILILIGLFLIIGCSQSKEIDTEILWDREDVSATGKLIKSSGGFMLTREVTLFQKPPFYDGKMPLKFLVVMKSMSFGTSMGMDEVPLQYIFKDRGYGILFIYKDMMSLMQRMPQGAVAIDLKTKTIVAECKVIKLLTEDKYLRGYEIKENHYKDGKAIFTSTFKVNSLEGYKQEETNAQGKKEIEYFFLYPGISGSF